jgi:hypothetical protein
MLIADTLNPPIQYELIWLIIGCGMALCIPVWYGLAFWLTRRKKVKTLDTLKPLPTGAALEKLKAKYLKLIEEWYQRYIRKEITLRELHANLSLVTRTFVYEAKHFPAPLLTLEDLKHAPYPALTALIAEYYPEEFASIESGNAEHSTEAAKAFVRQWI